jgi:hypothetical protein
MDFKEWFLSLSDDERERYARQAGTTAGYIRVHLIGRRKIPREELLHRLAAASAGKFTVAKLLAFFYQIDQPIKASVGSQHSASMLPRRRQFS